MPENNSNSPLPPSDGLTAASKIDSRSNIEWVDETIPRSLQFDDTYYSKADGHSETSHVFINGNRLIERWPCLDHCTIAELGFGTGLNFLETARQWEEVAQPHASLQFISFEQFPLLPDEMKHALQRWPQLAEEAHRLCEQWPEPQGDQAEGKIVNIQWSDRIHLTVHLGDANHILPQLDFRADAWYLDGFAPARNPELWNETLLSNVHERTKPGGTFATYTAAGWVRRNLTAAGFECSRIKGHAGKRQMSVGIKAEQANSDT